MSVVSPSELERRATLRVVRALSFTLKPHARRIIGDTSTLMTAIMSVHPTWERLRVCVFVLVGGWVSG